MATIRDDVVDVEREAGLKGPEALETERGGYVAGGGGSHLAWRSEVWSEAEDEGTE